MSTLRRSAVAIVLVAAIVGGVALAVHAIFKVGAGPLGESCTVGQYDIDTDQAATASTMVGVITTRGLPERAAVLTLAAGLQESKLTNIPAGDGDRDSVGVLQQRPSQGWGTVAQLSDLHYATNAFLDALLKVPDWQTIPLAEAVQAVQRSADGGAYAQHEPEAQALSDALTGRDRAGITCTFPAPALVATTAQVADQLSADLPVNAPTTSASTVVVAGAAWTTAAWFVANADRLGIDSVGYDGRKWSRTKGWQADTSASAARVIATMHT
ncbi:MAG TPA: hypothetical protein VK816_00250 [Jatrophihabitantaceae bacterium]|jgi:hypothetical protein|nr:hypothetical protein [Jatrophihabitantaceae bacterium]